MRGDTTETRKLCFIRENHCCCCVELSSTISQLVFYFILCSGDILVILIKLFIAFLYREN